MNTIIETVKTRNKGKRKKEHDDIPVGGTFWKICYVILCGILLLVTGYMLLLVISSPGSGWDYRVYMGAVNALNQGKDPYLLDNIKDYVGDNLPFVYPPHSLLLFEFLYLFHSIGIYRLFCVLLILISAYLVLSIDEKHHYFFFFSLLMTGFISLFWNLLTGNDSVIFLFFTAVIFYLLKKERVAESAVATGLMASLSLFPILFGAIFLFIKRSLFGRLKLICLAGGTLCVILLLSYLVNPALMHSFIQSLTSGTSMIHESGGMATPTPYLMFGDILKGFNLSNPIFIGILSLIYIVLVLVATYFFVKKNQNDVFKMYCLGFLSIFMLLPRIKPYAFIMLVVPLYFLMKDYSYRLKTLVFAGISLFPLVVYLNYWINPKLVPDLVNLYAQTMSLFFIFGFIILYDRYAPTTS